MTLVPQGRDSMSRLKTALRRFPRAVPANRSAG